MELQGLRGAGSEEVRPSKKTKNADSTGKQGLSGSTESADFVSISSSAKTAHKELHFVKAVKDLPEIRADKVQHAKEDLKSGKLLSPEVQKKTAEEILKIL